MLDSGFYFFRNRVENGAAGNPAALYKLHFGLFLHAYLAADGFLMLGEEIKIRLPFNLTFAGKY